MPDNSPSEANNINTALNSMEPKTVAISERKVPPLHDVPATQKSETSASAGSLEGRIESAEKWMIYLTAAIALFALCQVIAALLQWRAMKGQIDEMKEAGGQTNQLIDSNRKQVEQSGRQAANTEILALRMKEQADHTKVMADQAIIQAKATQISSNAAKSAADISATSLESSQRPWLTVRSWIASPLIFDKGEGRLTVHTSVMNIGHSPAIAVSIRTQFFLNTGQSENILQNRENLCASPPRRTRALGEVIFPGETFEQDWSIPADRASISESVKVFSAIVANIIGCVVYSSNFSDAVYHTGTIYSLRHVLRQTNRGPSFALRPDENVPVDQLDFKPDSDFAISVK